MAKKKKKKEGHNPFLPYKDAKEFIYKCPKCEGRAFITMGSRFTETVIPCPFEYCNSGYVHFYVSSKKEAEKYIGELTMMATNGQI